MNKGKEEIRKGNHAIALPGESGRGEMKTKRKENELNLPEEEGAIPKIQKKNLIQEGPHVREMKQNRMKQRKK